MLKKQMVFVFMIVLGLATPFCAAQNAPATLESLNKQFAIASKTGAAQLKFVAGEGGLICADISSAACTGRVYLLGGHVAAWQPTGQEPVIFMSSKSQYAVGKAIRGGVPVVFPWYDGKASSAVAGVGGPGGPQHGLVRTIEWQVEQTRDLGDGAISITLLTRSDEASKKFWPADYEAREQTTFGKQLAIEFQVKNTGREPMKYEEDLHTYFFVKDVRNASVQGLDGIDYKDKYDAGKQKKQQGNLALSTPADSIYFGAKGPVAIIDESLGRRINIDKTDSSDTIIWTPGSTRTVGDLGPNEWMNYVTIEVSNVGGNARTVGPGESKSMGFRVSISK